jgi:hypothetical protein
MRLLDHLARVVQAVVEQQPQREQQILQHLEPPIQAVAAVADLDKMEFLFRVQVVMAAQEL